MRPSQTFQGPPTDRSDLKVRPLAQSEVSRDTMGKTGVPGEKTPTLPLPILGQIFSVSDSNCYISIKTTLRIRNNLNRKLKTEKPRLKLSFQKLEFKPKRKSNDDQIIEDLKIKPGTLRLSFREIVEIGDNFGSGSPKPMPCRTN